MTVTELHIVIGKDGFVREQDGRQSLETVVTDIISGQYDEDAERVLRIVPPSQSWPHSKVIEDVTSQVAWAIHDRCTSRCEYITHGSAAYALVKRHAGIENAWECMSREEAAQ